MTHQWKVQGATQSIRADIWISRKLPHLSRNRIQKAFQLRQAKVNGRHVSKSTKLKNGDVVEFVQWHEERPDLSPLDLPLEILFEDEHLLFINKTSGIVVHPGAGSHPQTLVHALLFHCQGQLSSLAGEDRPGIVHRLDRQTSGVMVVAKSDEAYRGLSTAFAQRSVEKVYLCLVAGVPDRLSGSLRKPMGRHPVHRHKMCVRPDGKSAHTDWEWVSSSQNQFSLLRCYLHTGRTHQIRVHLADMGHPILGDTLYGYDDLDLPLPPARVMLHAWRLQLRHPLTHKTLRQVAPPPPDFQSLTPQKKS